MHLRSTCAFLALVFVLLAGCSGDAEQFTPVPTPPATCISPLAEEFREVVLLVGNRHLVNPVDGGWSRTGRTTEFQWGVKNHLPSRLDINMTWPQQPLGAARLSLVLDNPDSIKPQGIYGPYDGRSPIQVRLNLTGNEQFGDRLALHVGPPYQGGEIFGSTVLLRDEHIEIQVRQWYPCV